MPNPSARELPPTTSRPCSFVMAQLPFRAASSASPTPILRMAPEEPSSLAFTVSGSNASALSRRSASDVTAPSPAAEPMVNAPDAAVRTSVDAASVLPGIDTVASANAFWTSAPTSTEPAVSVTGPSLGSPSVVMPVTPATLSATTPPLAAISTVAAYPSAGTSLPSALNVAAVPFKVTPAGVVPAADAHTTRALDPTTKSIVPEPDVAGTDCRLSVLPASTSTVSAPAFATTLPENPTIAAYGTRSDPATLTENVPVPANAAFSTLSPASVV